MNRNRLEIQGATIRRNALKKKSEPMKRPDNWGELARQARRELARNKRLIG